MPRMLRMIASKMQPIMEDCRGKVAYRKTYAVFLDCSSAYAPVFGLSP
jgi:hypothetical protein